MSFRASLILFQSKTQLEFMLCIGLFCNNLTLISLPIFSAHEIASLKSTGHLSMSWVCPTISFWCCLFFWPLYFKVRSQDQIKFK